MIKLNIIILIIILIFSIFYIFDIIIIHKFEYFNNNFKCDTYGEICNKIDHKTDTCCIGYKCMRQKGNFNYKICVNDKDYVPINAYIPKSSGISLTSENIPKSSGISLTSENIPKSSGISLTSENIPSIPKIKTPTNFIPDVTYFGKNIFTDLENNLKKSICKISK
jgi:hypothetical protein